MKKQKKSDAAFDRFEKRLEEHRRQVDWQYFRGFGVPRKIPKGRVLVHNHVVPVGFHKCKRR
jgi:hypothetical protein